MKTVNVEIKVTGEGLGVFNDKVVHYLALNYEVPKGLINDKLQDLIKEVVKPDSISSVEHVGQVADEHLIKKQHVEDATGTRPGWEDHVISHVPGDSTQDQNGKLKQKDVLRMVDEGIPLTHEMYEVLKKAARPRKKDLRLIEKYELENSIGKPSEDAAAGLSEQITEQQTYSPQTNPFLSSSQSPYQTTQVPDPVTISHTQEPPTATTGYPQAQTFAGQATQPFNTPGVFFIPGAPEKPVINVSDLPEVPIPAEFETEERYREYVEPRFVALGLNFYSEMQQFADHFHIAGDNFRTARIHEIPTKLLYHFLNFIESMPKQSLINPGGYTFMGSEVQSVDHLRAYGFGFNHPSVYRPTNVFLI